MTINTYIRTEKAEKFSIGLDLNDRPLIIIYSDSEDIQDQENDGVFFEALLAEARTMMEDWQYKGYCQKLVKLIQSTYKDIE